MHSPRIHGALSLVLVLLAAFLFAESIKSFREWSYVGAGVSPATVITVYGEGEVFVRPDTAEFTFTVSEEGKESVAVRDAADATAEAIVNALMEKGLGEEDIKTLSYNLQPKYEWQPAACLRYPCDRKQIQTGFTVSMTVQVKVRDMDMAGELVALATEKGAKSVSGLTFTIDDEDSVIAEARKLAIDEAKTKADTLAQDLGVKLVRIVYFNEDRGYQPVPYLAREMADTAAAGMGGGLEEKAVTLPAGENRITSSVNITYEIR